MEPFIVSHYRGHRTPISSLCFHPNSDTLFSGSEDGSIISWDFAKDTYLCRRYNGHRGAVNDISMSSELMVSASEDCTVRLWVPSVTGQVISVKVHRAAVNSVCFNPSDSSLFVTCSNDKTIKLWSVNHFTSQKNQGKLKNIGLLHSFGDHKNSPVNSVRFSGDGTLLCTAAMDKTVRIYDTRQKVCAAILNNPVGRPLHADFNPCGTDYLGVITDDNIAFAIYDLRLQSIIQLYSPNLFTSPIRSFAFHPTGDYAICATDDAKTKILDLSEGRPLFTLHAAKSGLHAVAYCKTNNNLFATAGKDKDIYMWNHTVKAYNANEEVTTQHQQSSRHEEDEDSGEN